MRRWLVVLLVGPTVAAAAPGCVIPPPQGHVVPATGATAAAAVRTPKAAPRAGDNPFVGTAFYVDDQSSAKKQAETWRAARPDDAAAIARIAAQPKADWFGDWNPNVELAVDQRVTEIARAGGLPVMVVYNIPNRDCGQYSRGGAKAPASYKAWVRAVAKGSGDRRLRRRRALGVDRPAGDGRAARRRGRSGRGRVLPERVELQIDRRRDP